jgi:hypothetical protein
MRLFTANSNSTINAQKNPDAIVKSMITTNGGSSCDMDQTTERGHEATAQTIVQKYSKDVGGFASENTKNTRKNKPATRSVAQIATAANLLIFHASNIVMWTNELSHAANDVSRECGTDLSRHSVATAEAAIPRR